MVRGWLGVAIQPLDEAMAKSFGYDSTEGALVGDVLPNGPAKDAGLKPGDIVVRFGDTKIHDMQQLRNLAAATEPGTKVKIEVMRGGKLVSVNLRVAQRDNEEPVASTGDVSNELGLTVENLTPELARSLGVGSDVRGVVVTQVDPNGLAYLAGIEPGNVITDVQGVPVSNITELRRELAKQDLKSGVRLLIQAGDAQRFVLLQSRED